MERLAQWLNQNPWLNMLFLALALLSILVSVILYIKSKKEKRPCFNRKTFHLIEDNISKIEAVEIRYHGQKVQNLSLTKMALWNRGRDTISNQDVAPKDPLKIVVDPTAKLLAAEITYTANLANNFVITTDLQTGEIRIEFDYFHTNEGVVIQLYHTGTGSTDIMLKGTVKGVSEIRSMSADERYLTNSFIEPIDRAVERIKPDALGWVVAVPLAIISMPILGVLISIDRITSPMRKPPGQFNLQ